MKGTSRGLIAASTLLAACVGAPPPPPGAGTGDGGSSSTTGGPASSSGQPHPSTTADGTTASAPGEPLLFLGDEPVSTFDDVLIGEVEQELLPVTNLGDGPATGMSASVSAAPFAFVGGAYPGLGGTCADTLGPAEVCLLAIELAPDRFGRFEAELAVQHDHGEVGLGLQGRGVGHSDQLLANPGGERVGSPPPGWTNVGVGTWITGEPGEILPFDGVAFIEANTGPSGVEYVLEQEVLLDDGAWLELIGVGELRVELVSWARSRVGVDDHRVRLEYRDEFGGALGENVGQWSAHDRWEQQSVSELLPPGTRFVAVQLMCLKTQGTVCSAFYDGLELRVAYP